MHRLRVDKTPRGWCMSLRTDMEGATRSVLGAAVMHGRRALLQWRQQLIDAGEDEAWCAEFPKSGVGEGELVLGYAELAADACAKQGSTSFEYAAPRGCLSRRSLYKALRQRGLGIANPPLATASLDAISFLMAGVLAWCTLAIAALCHVPVSRKPAGHGWLLAVHGEWSSRTRHVLAEATGDLPPSAILVLGRPQVSLRKLADKWKQELATDRLPPIYLPWSLGSLLATIPQAWRLTLGAMRLASAAPYLPSFRSRVAMTYRAYLGTASARWWRQQAWPSATIAYGHTGNADTTLLELAQQATGHVTCHVVHGVSAGLNFVGRSSRALFRCGHDAAWHGRLGGYGKSLHLPACMPSPKRGHGGLLLLTNYAHPMNVDCRASGIRPECEVLAMVAAAWKQAAPQAGTMHWRPHPAMAALPLIQQQAVRDAASAADFSELAEGADWIAAAIRSRRVIATASTVAIQLLEAGVLPVVLIPESLDPDSALAQYPLVAHDPEELSKLLGDLESGVEDTADVMLATWRAIGPGRPATASDWLE